MNRNDRGTDRPISREQLQFLAAISTDWELKLRREQEAEANAARKQRLEEFVKAITVPEWSDRPSPPSKELQAFIDAITEREVFPVREANWNPAKHPRRGGPPNAGWWASTGGTERGNATTNISDTPGPRRSSIDRRADHWPPDRSQPKSTGSDGGDRSRADGPLRSRATSYSPAHGPEAHLTASSQPRGHHWVPRDVYKRLKEFMTDSAYAIFELGTKSPELYDHANDTWNGVKHWEYTSNMRALLEDWIRTMGGKLDVDAANDFLSWIALGKCNNPEFAAKKVSSNVCFACQAA